MKATDLSKSFNISPFQNIIINESECSETLQKKN